MILIADSGSTKTHWILAAADGALQSCVTRGINPFFLDKPAIINLLETEFMLPKEAIAAVYFYGAGCTPETIPGVIDALGTHFQSDTIEVHSDMLAAAHSLSRKEEGIVCILGTGSNSCHYDGEKIIDNVYSLGYVLGDEGSGAVLGKKLVADILRGTSSPKHSPLEPA
ncbi:MAG: ATPase, partial [Dysgonamonadaceae bacterium]|nr:ATPase [Dysgonamonadaceae bacterium]